MVAMTPAVLETARGALNLLLGARVIDGVAAGITGGHVEEVPGVALTPGIHSLVAAVVDIVSLADVCNVVVVDNCRSLRAHRAHLWIAGAVGGVRSLPVSWHVPEVEELVVGHPYKVGGSSRHVDAGNRSPSMPVVSNRLSVNLGYRLARGDSARLGESDGTGRGLGRRKRVVLAVRSRLVSAAHTLDGRHGLSSIVARAGPRGGVSCVWGAMLATTLQTSDCGGDGRTCLVRGVLATCRSHVPVEVSLHLEI